MPPWGRPSGPACLADVTAMHGCAIPEHDHAARHFAPQGLQEGDHLPCVDGAVLTMEVPLAFRRDRTASGEVSAGLPFPPHGGLADRRLGADDTGQGINARCIYQEERVLLGWRPLLRAGQVSSRQRARRAGFWGRQRSAWHPRLRCPGWDITPNSRRMTAAIRRRVHRSPRQPSAVGPRHKRLGRRASGSADTRHGAPGGERCCHAAGPASRVRVIHWRTAPSLTPSAAAIGRGDQPCCFRCQAWSRRASCQWVGVLFIMRVYHEPIPNVSS
jgi:hypothetical protein